MNQDQKRNNKGQTILIREPNQEEIERIKETLKNRAIAMKLVNEAASKGDPLAGALEALENIASPFYLGLDSDSDNIDLDVFP